MKFQAEKYIFSVLTICIEISLGLSHTVNSYLAKGETTAALHTDSSIESFSENSIKSPFILMGFIWKQAWDWLLDTIAY